MKLTIEQQVQKLAVQRIYSNTLIGVVGHTAVISLILFLLISKIPHLLILVAIIIHTTVLLRRIYISRQFSKVDELDNYQDIQMWISKYRQTMLYSGLSFGLILFLFQNLSIEYHFLSLSIAVGLAASAIFTIGEILSIYFTYLFSLLIGIFIFMILQDAEAYRVGSGLLILGLVYFGSTASRYANNFKEVILKEYNMNKHIFEKKQAHNKIIQQKDILDYQASHDKLTDLPNKVLFYDRLTQGIENAKRNSTILAVLFIDLDNFKNINDSLGHEIGDRILKDVTTRLKDTIRSHDTLARWGGDEFIIIVEDLNSNKSASLLAQKILHSLKEHFLIESQSLYISSSIGISLYPKDATEAKNLIKYSDSAMYKAKDEGKNNFQFYSDDMTKIAFERVVMETSLRNAIVNEEFIVHYQPQIDARTGKIIGMEALVRWEHPIKGLIAPFRFIPLAEETGLIVQIDKLVMAIAMEQFGKWYSDGYNPGILSLNLAIKHLEEDKYIEKLYDSMNRFSLDSQYIELEITESDVMKNPEDSISKLHEISSLGIKIAVDDFGTGYSSLAYLKRLPIHKLKIDKSFVDDILEDEDEDGRAIVKAVIALAKTLNLDIIAEGVESEEQKDFLLGHGCSNIQGYYYSKPIPADEMQEFMIKTQL